MAPNAELILSLSVINLILMVIVLIQMAVFQKKRYDASRVIKAEKREKYETLVKKMDVIIRKASQLAGEPDPMLQNPGTEMPPK